VHVNGFRRIICEEVTRVLRINGKSRIARVLRINGKSRIAREKERRIRTKICSGNQQRRDRVGVKTGTENVLLLATVRGYRLDSVARKDPLDNRKSLSY